MEDEWKMTKYERRKERRRGGGEERRGIGEAPWGKEEPQRSPQAAGGQESAKSANTAGAGGGLGATTVNS